MCRKSKPVVGITGNLGDAGCQLAVAYYDSVVKAGGIPVVLPPASAVGADVLEHIDALLLSGGGDLNPLLMGEEPVPQLHGVCPERDGMELPLVRLAVRRRMPVLGICRGAQVLAAALGGRVYQDIYSQHDGRHIKHSQDMARQYASHSIAINDGSLLGTLGISAKVNSFHHQAVAEVPAGFRVAATAADGIIEAIEEDLAPEYVNAVGVQWHPECMAEGAPLFGWLVERAQLYKEARDIHRRIVTIDSHEDTPMLFDLDTEAPLADGGRLAVNFDDIDPVALVTRPRMMEGGLDCGIMVAYIPQGDLDERGHQAAFAMANRLLDGIQCLGIGIARTPDDILRYKHSGQPCVMLGVENGYAIGGDIDNVDHFARRGCVYITLCHNGDNLICDSAKGQHTHGGLSPFGRRVVERMNETGMMVCLSHAASSSFYDALECSRTPIICSHSSARALCDHPRNLDDQQLRALAARGGVAQLTLYHGFLRSGGRATIEDAMLHLDHMARVAGVEHVGLGTDFDGDGGIAGLANASELMSFTMSLLSRRYSEADIQAIWGGNLLRVMREAQGYGTQSNLLGQH